MMHKSNSLLRSCVLRRHSRKKRGNEMRDRTALAVEARKACPMPEFPTVFGQKRANRTGPPAGERQRTERTITMCAEMPDVGMTLTSWPMCIESADRADVDMIMNGSVASGYLDLGEMISDQHEDRLIGIGDSFDGHGSYLGQSVTFSDEILHFWDEVNITGDMYVVGDLNVKGPLNVGGDLYVTGDLHTNDDVRISGGLTVRGAVSIYGEDVTLACHGLADVRDIKIFGKANTDGMFILYGALEVMGGGRMSIGAYDVLTFVRNGDTRTPRLMVDKGASVCVRGILDATALVSTQIHNEGGIHSHEFGGTVDIYYDVYVFVNGNDRSQGELAAHGKELRIFPNTNGDIISAEVTVNDVPLDRGSYDIIDGSVTVSAHAVDGVVGDVEVFVTSDYDTLPETPKEIPEEGYSEEASYSMLVAMIPAVMYIISQGRKGP